MDYIIQALENTKMSISKEWGKRDVIGNREEEARYSGRMQGLNTAIEIVKAHKPIVDYLAQAYEKEF